MRRLSDFLGFPCSKERLSCVVRNQEGNYHRPPVKSDINRYPGSLHFTVQEAIQAVRDELKSRSESDLETVANLDQWSHTSARNSIPRAGWIRRYNVHPAFRQWSRQTQDVESMLV